MTPPRRCRPGRRAVGLAWLAVLLLLTVVALPASRPAARPGQAEEPPPDDLPPPVAPRDTTGQARLQWEVSRPQRQASLVTAERTIYRIIDGEAITFYYGNFYLDRDTVVVRADSAHVFRERHLARLFDNAGSLAEGSSR